MATRVGINGFGRIGTLVAKAAMEREGIEVVAANDVMPFESLAYLFKRDSVHGVSPEEVSFEGNVLRIGDREIKPSPSRSRGAYPGRS